MNKNQQPNVEKNETVNRDDALRQQQVELIEEDIKMHEETDERSPLEGSIDQLEQLREVDRQEDDEEDEPVKPKAKPEPKKK